MSFTHGIIKISEEASPRLEEKFKCMALVCNAAAGSRVGKMRKKGNVIIFWSTLTEERI